MINKAVKDNLIKQIASLGYDRLYHYLIFNNLANSCNYLNAKTCKQELCSYLYPRGKIADQYIVFSKVNNKAKFKANLNRIEELLGIKVGKICFLNIAEDRVSFLLSPKSYWAQSFFLLDLFCILFRSANCDIDIREIDDIFTDQHKLGQNEIFQQIVRNFGKFTEIIKNQETRYHGNAWDDSYGVLDFAKELGIN